MSLILNKIGFGADFYDEGFDKKYYENFINKAIDIGYNFFDTAEIYSNGLSEIILGETLKKHRQNVFISTKFSPENATYDKILKSCENSLKRLQTDYIDLYQIHWPSIYHLEEISKAFQALKTQGKVLNFGVSNYNHRLISQINNLLDNSLFSNQIEYNYFDRYIEDKIYPYCLENNILIIAYSPLNKGRVIFDNDKVNDLAIKYDCKPQQILLNWLISKKNILAIPKTNNINNLKSNFECLDINIEKNDLISLDKNQYEVHLVDTKKINVILNGEKNRNTYTTLQEAIKNHLNYFPGPVSLSEQIKIDNDIKPVRLIKTNKDTYDLVEGRIKYWAWVLAFGYDVPIPSYIYNFQ